MADISQIKLPNGSSTTTYDIKDAKKKGVYVVKGTHTTATVAWTGAIDVPVLYDGLTIAYYLPISATSGSTQVTLNLTLSDGTTTGAVKCFYNASKLTRSYYPAGSSILMTYWGAGSISISGTATTEARWIASADYNANTWRNIQINGTQAYSTSTSSGALNLVPGTNIDIVSDGGAPASITISDTANATTIPMSSTDSTTIASAIDAKAEKSVIREYIINSTDYATIWGVGSYAVLLVIGFAQGIGAVSLIVNIVNNALSVVSMGNGQAWSSSNLTFAYNSTGKYVIIRSAQAGNSRITVIKGGLTA